MKPLARLPVPPGPCTETLATPAVPAGVTAVMLVDDTTVKDGTATPPMRTAVAPVKLVPVMVMAVPPAAGPWAGVTDDTVGGGVDPVHPLRTSARSPPSTSPSPFRSAASSPLPHTLRTSARSVPSTMPSPFTSPGTVGGTLPSPTNGTTEGVPAPPTRLVDASSTRNRSSPPMPSRLPREQSDGWLAPRSVSCPSVSAAPGPGVSIWISTAFDCVPVVRCTLTMSRSPSSSASMRARSMPADAPSGAMGTAAPKLDAVPRNRVSTGSAAPVATIWGASLAVTISSRPSPSMSIISMATGRPGSGIDCETTQLFAVGSDSTVTRPAWVAPRPSTVVLDAPPVATRRPRVVVVVGVVGTATVSSWAPVSPA